MDLASVKSLSDLADRAERLATGLLQLELTESNVRVPAPPLSLTLDPMEDWLLTVNESLRKPRRTHSTRLLEERGIDVVPISASVLDDPDGLLQILAKIDALPITLQATASAAIGRALTKGIEDASVITDRFSRLADALRELESNAAAHPWIHKLALQGIAKSPETAAEIIADAQQVLQLASAVEQGGVQIASYDTFSQASQALTDFNLSFTKYHQLLIAEGVIDENVQCDGFDTEQFQRRFEEHRLRIADEKLSLERHSRELNVQLQAVGGQCVATGVSLADLRKNVVEIREGLRRQRGKMRAVLGTDTFKVVEPLLRGECPAQNDVSDTEFGNALRRALDCGYRLKLDVPDETQ